MKIRERYDTAHRGEEGSRRRKLLGVSDVSTKGRSISPNNSTRAWVRDFQGSPARHSCKSLQGMMNSRDYLMIDSFCAYLPQAPGRPNGECHSMHCRLNRQLFVLVM